MTNDKEPTMVIKLDRELLKCADMSCTWNTTRDITRTRLRRSRHDAHDL
jgi:hypothetical protein